MREWGVAGEMLILLYFLVVLLQVVQIQPIPILGLSSNKASPHEIIHNEKVPSWPDKFTTNFNVFIQDYGDKWKSGGIVYYDWKIKTFRADYIDWCLSPFQSNEEGYDNCTCSYLATEDTMYFINHTASNWDDNECCIFEKGLGTVPPDWMKDSLYNGTVTVNGELVDVWWVPGHLHDPHDPCYAYWNVKDKLTTPVGFYGISPHGPTMMNYYDYKPGTIPIDVKMKPPASKDCNVKCTPPNNTMKRSTITVAAAVQSNAPIVNWPKCPE